MQRLNRGMLSRYDIPEHRPDGVRMVQFGLDEVLLGAADRLLDAAESGVGIACVAAGEKEEASWLREQDGLYTVLVRGYEGETPVRREVVVQGILEVIDPEADFDALKALAARPELELGLLNMEGTRAELALALAARLLAERWRAGRGGLCMLCLGDGPECAGQALAFVRRVCAPWGLGDAFDAWLGAENRWIPALAEGLAFRAEPEEAAKICADMNYADRLLFTAEPFARLTLGLAEAEADALGLNAPGVVCAEDVSGAALRRERVFDAILAALAAPGWLLGCDTLSDCMKHERLRACVGGIVYRELLPALPLAREESAAAIIEAFSRLENPLNAHRILRAASPLLDRVERGLLPALRTLAERDFDAPEGLSFALAATIMLYAGARPGKAGYEVVRGSHTEVLVDDPARLAVFATLSHDMPPEALAYAALADRELWRGQDLREIDGLEDRVALAIAALQRDPAWLPELGRDNGE